MKSINKDNTILSIQLLKTKFSRMSLDVGVRDMNIGNRRQAVPMPPQKMNNSPHPYFDQVCDVCHDPFKIGITNMNYKGKSYHVECFVCEQCFRYFLSKIFL
jgi:hypothetical protein